MWCFGFCCMVSSMGQSFWYVNASEKENEGSVKEGEDRSFYRNGVREMRKCFLIRRVREGGFYVLHELI